MLPFLKIDIVAECVLSYSKPLKNTDNMSCQATNTDNKDRGNTHTHSTRIETGNTQNADKDRPTQRQAAHRIQTTRTETTEATHIHTTHLPRTETNTETGSTQTTKTETTEATHIQTIHLPRTETNTETGSTHKTQTTQKTRATGLTKFR